jgi:hypothetical protein
MIPSRLRTPNPHLGAYYGIVTSAFVSLIIILAMFEQLGWGRLPLAQCMMLVPLALYLLIAVGARTFEVEDYFVSGRRVPPVFNGFALAAVAVGGVGFLAYTGTVFFLGFDALAIGLGWTFGMLLAAILFVPYLRKAGPYTVPSFLGHRFRSRGLRMAASVMQRCLIVLWSVLTIVLAVTGADAQPTVTITMRLAEAEWHVVRQEVLPRFEAVCNCRIRAIDIPPETLVQRLRAMQQAGRMEIDLFAQDNMRLRELVDTALAVPFTSEEGQAEEPDAATSDLLDDHIERLAGAIIDYDDLIGFIWRVLVNRG